MRRWKNLRNDIEIVNKLISDFYNSVDKRSPIFLVNFDEVFPKILEWNFIAWRQYWLNFQNKKKREEWHSWYMVSHKLNELVTLIGKRSYENQSLQFLFTGGFLKKFHDHVNSRKDEHVSAGGGEKYYVVDLFRIFYNGLFKFLESGEPSISIGRNQYFWDNFPNEWKITKETWKLGQLSWNEFLSWALPRIQEKKDYDRTLQEVTKNLFPHVDFKTWSRILIFVCSQSYDENRVKSVIERPWTFGYTSPTLDSFGNGLQGDAIERTFELALPLFSSMFTEENLKQYKTDAEKLDYPDNPLWDRRKKELLEIFDGLLNRLKKQSEEKA